ncbi:GreA/GreB family elongation factor [Hymenobacter rubripertinctus]|uniref:Transcription elongation factor GreAB n=1 Tax=Hymenobacter rubripertinctus TaxID=2029981 RepID=A0A418QV65_9BACT|nr:GreA/GreB family elongation factor [Hymenobacter rubripertinctus]RIY09116.1 transcription elongation factor GreAB [Hymenobacter rubripertinctus]
MKTPLSSSSIYVTKLDYHRLTHLGREEHPVGRTARQVAALMQELTRAQLVDSHDILPDVVTMNSRLKLRALHSAEELHFTLVYPPDADQARHRVSVLEPVGIAVLGCRLGDQLRLSHGTGAATYWVEDILHQPEAAGDWVS